MFLYKKRMKKYFSHIKESPPSWILIVELILCLIGLIMNFTYSPLDVYNSYKIRNAKTAKERKKLQLEQDKQLVQSNRLTKLALIKKEQGFLTFSEIEKYGNSKHMYIATDPKTGVEYFYRNPNINSTDKTTADITLQKRTDSNNKPIINKKWQKLQASKLTDKEKDKIKDILAKNNFQGQITIYRYSKLALNYNTANKSDNEYLINSLQKSITAAMILHQVSNGNLKLNQKISKYYPSLAGSSQITIADLLNMTSGLKSSFIPDQNNITFRNNKQFIKYLTNNTIFIPDRLGKFTYDSVNYLLLAEILAKISKKSYNTLFKEEFINKLNLKQTSFNNKNSNVLEGNKLTKDKNYKPVTTKQNHLDNMIGAGNLYMSNQDLAKIIQEILQDTSYISSTVRKASLKNTGTSGYHNGFYTYKNIKAANGAANGFFSTIRSDDKGKDLLILQTNYDNNQFDNFKKISDEIFKIVQTNNKKDA